MKSLLKGIDKKQLKMGMKVELEHGKRDPDTNVTDDDPSKTAKIAVAHIRELPDYYTRLHKMEKEGKKAKSKTEEFFDRVQRKMQEENTATLNRYGIGLSIDPSSRRNPRRRGLEEGGKMKEDYSFAGSIRRIMEGVGLPFLAYGAGKSMAKQSELIKLLNQQVSNSKVKVPKGLQQLRTSDDFSKWIDAPGNINTKWYKLPRLKKWIYRKQAEFILPSKLDLRRHINSTTGNAFYMSPETDGGQHAIAIPPKTNPHVARHEIGHYLDMKDMTLKQRKKAYRMHTLKSTFLGAEHSPMYQSEYRAWEKSGVNKNHPIRNLALGSYRDAIGTDRLNKLAGGAEFAHQIYASHLDDKLWSKYTGAKNNIDRDAARKVWSSHNNKQGKVFKALNVASNIAVPIGFGLGYLKGKHELRQAYKNYYKNRAMPADMQKSLSFPKFIEKRLPEKWKLTPVQRQTIKALARSGKSKTELAKQYRVSRSYVSKLSK